MPQLEQVIVTNNNTGAAWQTQRAGDAFLAPDGGAERVDCHARLTSPPPAGFINDRNRYTIVAVYMGQGIRFHAADLHTYPEESDPPTLYSFRRSGG